MTRFYSVLALALAVVLAACADDPAPTPATPEPSASVEAPPPLETTAVVEQRDSTVAIPSPTTPDAPSASPTAPPIAETPLSSAAPREPTPTPPRVEPPTEPTPTTPARTDRAAVEAFWTRFQGALRARNADAIDDYLHTTVRVSGQDYDRNGPQVQEVVRQFAENPDLTEAYIDLPANQLEVDGSVARFRSTARYTLADETIDVPVFGTIREVTPGTWRIVELGSGE